MFHSPRGDAHGSYGRAPAPLAALRLFLSVGLIAISTTACGRAQGQAPATAGGSTPQIQLAPGAGGLTTIEVRGVPAGDLSRLGRSNLTRDEWTRVLRVDVSHAATAAQSTAATPPSTGGPVDRPAVLGRYEVTGGVLRFTPQFPLEAGTRYVAELDLAALAGEGDEGPSDEGLRSAGPDADARHSSAEPRRIRATLQVAPLERRGDATRIVEVYPSAPELPENQLRMYISFSAPMGLKDGLPYIHLLDERGETVVDPFLPLDVNLWNDDRTRYTLLFDPGRQKSGILPNEQMGRSLVAGRKYTLVVDASWPDGAGQPLDVSFRREFRVGPAVEHAIEPSAWRVQAPAEGTRDPLTVTFPGPLDYALLHRAVRVAAEDGALVSGMVGVDANETRWTFTPRGPWKAGGYQLVAASTLEDVAGNRIGRPFEVSMLHVTSGPGAQRAAQAVVPFQVVQGASRGR